jgi:hypothetical protein
MDSKTRKIAFFLAGMLVVASIAPVAVLAASQGKRNKGAGSGPLEMTQDHAQAGVRPSNQILQDYRQARENMTLAKTMMRNGSLTTAELVIVSKDYLNTTIECMISHLEESQELFEANADEEKVSLLEGYISDLDDAREELKGANTRKGVAGVGHSVLGTWQDANRDIRLLRTARQVRGLENYLVQTERLSGSVNAEIARLNGSGAGTSYAGDMLAEYDSLMAEAGDYLDLARDRDNSTEAAVDIKLAISSIKEGDSVLRGILAFLKDRRPGFARFSGSGGVTAEGSGTAVFSGDLGITLSASASTLVIKDISGDAVIEVEGEHDPAGRSGFEDVSSPAVVYTNFTGDAFISGSRLTVMVRGIDISVEAEGNGSAMFSGEGSYVLRDDEGFRQDSEWAHIEADVDEED